MQHARRYGAGVDCREIPSAWNQQRLEDTMATQDDVTIVPGDEEMTFHCRACLSQFTAMAANEVLRGRARGTLDQDVRLIVAGHIRDCTGPAPDAATGGKKAGKPHKP
jgi:hypothetical protein